MNRLTRIKGALMSFKLPVTSSTIAVAVAACVSSCFSDADRPVVIADVAIGLLDQMCECRITSAAPEQRTVNVQLTIQARNTGLLNAAFDPHGIALMADGTDLPTIAADKPTIIRPGSARTFTLRFEGSGPMRCDSPMAIVLDRALELQPAGTAHYRLRFRRRASVARALGTIL